MEAVLALAVRWQLEQVVEACCSFLGDRLCPSNCLAVLRLAGDNSCSGLKSVARFYIAVLSLLMNCMLHVVEQISYSIERCTHCYSFATCGAIQMRFG